MHLDPVPRLPKWTFIAIDAGLLLTAFVIIYFADNPYEPLPFVCAILCVGLAAIIGLIPFITDYAADSAEAAQRQAAQLRELTARLQDSMEHLSRAAAQIKSVEEAVHKAAREAETLPYRMQEKLAEFNEALAEKENEEREALEQELNDLRSAQSGHLKEAADKIAKATADWKALETTSRKHLAEAEAALAKLPAADSLARAATDAEARLQGLVAQIDSRVAALEKAAASVAVPVAAAAAATPAPVVETRAEPVAAEVPAPAEPELVPAAPSEEPPPPAAEPADVAAPAEPEVSPAVAAEATPASELSLTPPAEVAPPKPRKPRAPRKPKVEAPAEPAPEVAPAAAEPAAVEAAAVEAPAPTPVEPEAAPAPAPEEPAASAPEPVAAASADTSGGDSMLAAESSTSSDGATRLLATAYIGIGNKLFIRGDGPGLSWDAGVPMQFVSIGKWGWHTYDASGPIRCKLYKNDETSALSGEIVLEPGRHTEVTALF